MGCRRHLQLFIAAILFISLGVRGAVVSGINQTPVDGYYGNTWIKDFWQTHPNIWWRCQQPGTVALTFDDGPGSVYEEGVRARTEKILDVLKLFDIPATFFVQGKVLSNTTEKLGLLTRMVEEGHQISHHMYDHTDIREMNDTAVASELEDINEFFREHFKYGDVLRSSTNPSTRYVRPPYLGMDEQKATLLQTLGYKVVQISASGQDSSFAANATDSLRFYVCEEGQFANLTCPFEEDGNKLKAPFNEHDGYSATTDSWITLHHDLFAIVPTHETLMDYIPIAAAQGYKFVTVEQCLGDAPIPVNQTVLLPFPEINRTAMHELPPPRCVMRDGFYTVENVPIDDPRYACATIGWVNHREMICEFVDGFSRCGARTKGWEEKENVVFYEGFDPESPSLVFGACNRTSRSIKIKCEPESFETEFGSIDRSDTSTTTDYQNRSYVTAANFTSNLPVLTLEIVYPQTQNQTELNYGHEYVKRGGDGTSEDFGTIVRRFDAGQNVFTESPTFAHYAGVRERGQSSSLYNKRGLKVEFWDSDDEGDNVHISHFPKEEDFVLRGPFTDKSLLRDHLGYSAARQTGRYCPRTELHEVFIKEDRGPGVDQTHYAGVYVFTESVKRDKNRVNVEKIQPDGTTGLILKVDAAFGEGSAALVKGTFYTEGADGKADVLQQGLFIDYPKEEDLTESILHNTQEFISGLESELDRINDPAATDARNVESPSYRKYIDPTSFVDYQLIQELADNGDAYFRSTFFHKEIGGRLQAGPIWDLDLAFGNVGWDMETPASDFKYNFMEGRPFFAQLNKDVNYKCLVVCRRNMHRVGGLSDEWFEGFFNENRALLSKGASEREFKRWKTLGQYVPRVSLGFNSTAPSFYLESWEDEVDMLQKWVSMRLRFMDNVMQGQKEYLNCDCEYADEWAQIIE